MLEEKKMIELHVDKMNINLASEDMTSYTFHGFIPEKEDFDYFNSKLPLIPGNFKFKILLEER